MQHPESSFNTQPQEQSPVFFDTAKFKESDKRQDENLETITHLLKERKRTQADGLQLIPVENLEETKVLFFQLHDEFLAIHEAALRASQHIQFEHASAIQRFKEVDEQLQEAFEKYANALRRSYQN